MRSAMVIEYVCYEQEAEPFTRPEVAVTNGEAGNKLLPAALRGFAMNEKQSRSPGPKWQSQTAKLVINCCLPPFAAVVCSIPAGPVSIKPHPRKTARRLSTASGVAIALLIKLNSRPCAGASCGSGCNPTAASGFGVAGQVVPPARSVHPHTYPLCQMQMPMTARW